MAINIADLFESSLADLAAFMETLALPEELQTPCGVLVEQIRRRLGLLTAQGTTRDSGCFPVTVAAAGTSGGAGLFQLAQPVRAN